MPKYINYSSTQVKIEVEKNTEDIQVVSIPVFYKVKELMIHLPIAEEKNGSLGILASCVRRTTVSFATLY